jgi:glycosyltransferase involved in cell wall biosynthesis
MALSYPLKLTLVISSLSCGGAERVISMLANYCEETGRDVTLITLDSISTDFFRLNPMIKRIGLGLISESSNPLIGMINNLVRIARLRHEIRLTKPDVVITFMEKINVLTLLSTRGLGLRIIVSERTDPAHHNIGRVWNLLRRITYPWADIIVAQNNQVKQWLINIFVETKVIVIPNPITCEYGDADCKYLNEITEKKENTRSIVAIGRLSFEKGFDLLINAFAKIALLNSGWQLIIFGEGDERHALERLICKLNLNERVYLPGRVSNPMRFLKQAELFVMSSRFEGFPNSLLEAMACGLPVVSFDCPSGPREIIRDGVDGMLVPAENIEALADVLQNLMIDGSLRKRLADKAPEVLERFGLEKIMEMWEITFRRILEIQKA